LTYLEFKAVLVGMENNKNQPDFFSAQISRANRFYLTHKDTDDSKLTVVCGGYEVCDADYKISRETFPYYSIEFVAIGRGRLLLAGREYELTSGALFTYGPGIKHEIINDKYEPMTKYFVDFYGKPAVELLESSGLAPGTLVLTTLPNELASIFDFMINEGHKNTPYSADITAKFLEIILHKVKETAITYGMAVYPGFSTYLKCRHIIELNWHKITSLEQAAKLCHINPSYLCRLFHKFDTQTPYDMIIKIRMNRAAEMLLEPGALVKEVADKLGYADQFHFSRVFKKVFGISPSEYARRYYRGI